MGIKTFVTNGTGHRAGIAQPRGDGAAAPWKIAFSLDVREVYGDLRVLAQAEAGAETFSWLFTVSLLHQEKHLRNLVVVRRLTRLSAALAVVTTVQSLLWIVAIGVR